MMNIEEAKKEFLEYTNKYDLTNFHIKRKISHSLRVMELSNTIAKNLNLSTEKVELATLIGLLHDIGRFEQMTIYKTFDDRKSIDHGNFGVEILKNNNYIRNYIKEDIYDNTIFTAIKNHNKFEIEDNINENELLFCKIIRDADKIDILYQGTNITWVNNIETLENVKITEDDIQAFVEKRLVNRNKDLIQASRDLRHFLTVLGFIFDINFDISYKILKENDYINKIIDRFDFKDEETKENVEKVRNIVNMYIDGKQKG